MVITQILFHQSRKQERERHTDRERERDRQTDRQRKTDRQTDRQRQRETDRDKDSERELTCLTRRHNHDFIFRALNVTFRLHLLCICGVKAKAYHYCVWYHNYDGN